MGPFRLEHGVYQRLALAGEPLAAQQRVNADDQAQDQVFEHRNHRGHRRHRAAHHALHRGQQIGGGPALQPGFQIDKGIVYVILQYFVAIQVIQDPVGQLVYFWRDDRRQGHDACDDLRNDHVQQQVDDQNAQHHDCHNAQCVGPFFSLFRQKLFNLPLQKAAGGFQQIGHGAAVHEGLEDGRPPLDNTLDLAQVLDGEIEYDGQSQREKSGEGLVENLFKKILVHMLPSQSFAQNCISCSKPP